MPFPYPQSSLPPYPSFPLLQTAPGRYNEAALRGLDYMVEEARKAGIRVSEGRC